VLCAVGYLIAASGAPELARSINREYVLEIAGNIPIRCSVRGI
jgi:hypothetical protein